MRRWDRGFLFVCFALSTTACSGSRDRDGLDVRPIFGRPAPFVPAPVRPPADPIDAPPIADPPVGRADCDDACEARGLVCVAEGLCAERVSHDTGLEANAGRYAVAPLGDPSRPDGVAIAYQEYQFSSASDDRNFLHVGVLGARDGSFTELTRQRLPPTQWVVFDVAVGGPIENRRVLAAWQEDGVRLGSYGLADGASRVVQVSTHPIENVLDVVGTPTGGVVADGEPGENPRIVPRLYRIDALGGLLDVRTPPTWEEGAMLDRTAGATLVAAPDGGIALAYVRRSIEPTDATASLELLRDRSSLAEVERVTLRPTDGSTMPIPYEPVRAWALPNRGGILFSFSQASHEGTRARLGLSNLHVGGSESITLGPDLDERPDDIAPVSVDGVDQAVAVSLRTEADDEFEGCGPPPLLRAELFVRAIDPSTLDTVGDAVVVEARDAVDGEWQLMTAPRVVALGDGTYGFVVTWLDEGTIRYRRFAILAPEAPPPVHGS